VQRFCSASGRTLDKAFLHVKPIFATLSPAMARIGIKDVAEAAGVSVTTVSHALNGKGRLPVETRERVQRVARDLGYRPSSTARNLVGGRTGLIGLTVSQAQGLPFALSDFDYFSQVMSACASAAMERGYALVLTPPAAGGDVASMPIDVDGAVIVDPVVDDPLAAALQHEGVPLVTTGRVPGSGDGNPWVDNDHVAATRSVLDHLERAGARSVALVTGPSVTSYTIDVEEAYRAWCDERSGEPLVAYAREDLTEGAGYEAAVALLDRPVRVDAVYATLDRLALGVLLAARARGIGVPDELLVAGSSDSDAARLASPSLTVLRLNPDEIGRRAVDLLADRIEHPDETPENVLVATRLVVRASTRRLSAARAAGRRG
jgi:DNA-binding LacI/PurR family transcriptional regulator